MAGESETKRELLTSFLETKFYEPCKFHTKKKCTFFCLDCMGSTFCDSCNHKATRRHRGIKVLNGSKENAVRRNDMELLSVDMSEIQKYKIHGGDVAFLKRRLAEGDEPKQVQTSAKYCAICRWKLLADSYIYCSIECKVKSMEGMGETSIENQNIQLMEQTHEEGVDTTQSNLRSMRKTGRKGMPSRSPFF